jgi:hypothetical protein
VFALQCLAEAHSLAGDLPGARQRYGEALAAARAFGAERLTVNIAFNLAEAEFCGGNAAEAVRLADEALAALRTMGDASPVVFFGESNMAAYLVALGKYFEARLAARDAVTTGRDMQLSISLAFAMQHLAAIAALRPGADALIIEDRRRGSRILGYVDARVAALEAVREYTEQQEYDAMLPALRDALGESELSKLMAEGSNWGENQAIAEALLI